MREKLNSNPIAQVAVIAVLLVAAAVFLLGGMGGGEEEASETPVTTTAPEGTTVAPAIGSPEEAAPESAVTPTPVATAAISVPRLPAPVTRAYDAGKTVVLLIVHNGGIDDQLVIPAVRSLDAAGNIAVFIVPATQVARYAAVTLGVQVDRTPALIVMRPKGLSDGTPEASVSYGFQSPQAIVQAVLDASYDGPPATYYPN